MKLNKRLTIIFILLVLILLGALLVGNFLRRPLLPEVASTTPPNGASNVSDTLIILINFAQEVSEENRKKITVTTNPSSALSPSWDENQFTLSLEPSSPLQPDTLYTTTVKYEKQPIYNFTFTTQKYSTQELTRQIEEQAEGDRIFAEAEKNLIQTYPWYTQLPIETADFRIVYDYDRKSFRIRILRPSPSPEEKSQIVETALNRLKAINVDPDKETYYLLP